MRNTPVKKRLQVKKEKLKSLTPTELEAVNGGKPNFDTKACHTH
jgi:hypothetical protein